MVVPRPSRGGSGGHGVRRRSGCRGELNSARRWEGSGEGGRERALHELKGEEWAEGIGRWRKGAWHGASSPWRFERPASACAQGDGAAWRGREASGRIRERGGEFGRGGRRVAGGETATNGEATALRQGRRRWW